MSLMVFFLSIPVWVELFAGILGIVDAGDMPRRRANALRRFAARVAVASVWLWMVGTHALSFVAAGVTVAAFTLIGHYGLRLYTRTRRGIGPQDEFI